MKEASSRTAALEERALAFGEDLLGSFQNTVESNLEKFNYTVTEATDGQLIGTLRSAPRPRVQLYSRADGELVPTFAIGVIFRVFYDEFLTVQESSIDVGLGASDRDEPIFRYEYQRYSNSDTPTAHLHVHGHRDEFVHGMLLGATGRSKQRSQVLATKRLNATRPTMSQIHFPLGGPRLRPGIEDVLHLLISEFGVATKPNWRNYLESQRRQWRELQLRTFVRRNPHLAAEVLNGMDGYEVVIQNATESVQDPSLGKF